MLSKTRVRGAGALSSENYDQAGWTKKTIAESCSNPHTREASMSNSSQHLDSLNPAQRAAAEWHTCPCSKSKPLSTTNGPKQALSRFTSGAASANDYWRCGNDRHTT